MECRGAAFSAQFFDVWGDQEAFIHFEGAQSVADLDDYKFSISLFWRLETPTTPGFNPLAWLDLPCLTGG